MRGVQFVVDEKGQKTAVIIDLREYRGLWEDFHDAALARGRRREPRETLAAVKRRLRRNGKLRARRPGTATIGSSTRSTTSPRLWTSQPFVTEAMSTDEAVGSD